jgi:hypothetical protein
MEQLASTYMMPKGGNTNLSDQTLTLSLNQLYKYLAFIISLEKCSRNMDNWIILYALPMPTE